MVAASEADLLNCDSTYLEPKLRKPETIKAKKAAAQLSRIN